MIITGNYFLCMAKYSFNTDFFFVSQMTDMKVHMDWGGLFIVYFQKLIYPGQDSCDLNNCVFLYLGKQNQQVH